MKTIKHVNKTYKGVSIKLIISEIIVRYILFIVFLVLVLNIIKLTNFFFFLHYKIVLKF